MKENDYSPDNSCPLEDLLSTEQTNLKKQSQKQNIKWNNNETYELKTREFSGIDYSYSKEFENFSIQDFFDFYLPNEIIEYICDLTNERILSKRKISQPLKKKR